MRPEKKTFSGVMNLDDPNEVIPTTHHKEAKNGVFRGTAPEMNFISVMGNTVVNNANLYSHDCKMTGTAVKIS